MLSFHLKTHGLISITIFRLIEGEEESFELVNDGNFFFWFTTISPGWRSEDSPIEHQCKVMRRISKE